MGAHVFIVTSDTFPIVKNRGVAAVISEDPSKTLSEKTKADILADISCIRKGDKIFFYEIEKGFHGIYEIISNPFIDEVEIEYYGKYIFGSENNPHFKKNSLLFPYRILIKPKILLEKAINEWRDAEKSAFGRFTSSIDLRSIFYKKVLGRGKSITHLFPEEENKLTELLLKVNREKNEKITYNQYVPENPKSITFNLEPSSNGEVKYEKIFRGLDNSKYR